MTSKKFIIQLIMSIIFFVIWNVFTLNSTVPIIRNSNWVTYGGEIEALLAALPPSLCILPGLLPALVIPQGTF